MFELLFWLGLLHFDLNTRPPTDPSVVERDLRARIQNEAIPAWEHYLERGSTLHGNWLHVANFEGGGKEESAVKYKKLDKCRLYHYSQTQTRGTKTTTKEEIFASNPKYSFLLRRKDDGKTWVLIETVPHTDEAAPAAYQKRYATCDMACTRAVRLGNTSLPDAVKDPEFRITRISEGDFDHSTGAALIHLEFAFPKVRTGEFKDHIVGGTITLDAAKGWTIKEAELRVQDKDLRGIRSRRCSDYYVDGGLYIPGRVTELSSTSNPNGLPAKSQHEMHQEYTTSTKGLSLYDFTLSAYGFIEPFGVEWPKPTPWFLYFSAGGFGLFFLALFLWRVLAKRQARGAA
jgi:hypothetical protein